MNMEPFIVRERNVLNVPKMDIGKVAPNTAFKELNDNMKKIIELLESIDATIKEINKSQK
jgi:hypothetical protein